MSVNPSTMDLDSDYMTSLGDTISIGTANDNFSQTFFMRNISDQFAEPLSLDPRIRRSNSLDSRISELAVNQYFQHHQPRSTENHPDATLTRTKTFLGRDWKDRIGRRSSWLDEISEQAIKVIQDNRPKLTIQITDAAVLFPYLKQMEILTANDCEKIDSQPLRSMRTDALIDTIITRGMKGIVYFCESLKLHYNHLYEKMKHNFEIDGIEIESLLDNGGRKGKVISEIFRSIEDIMGPKFAQETLDAQHLLDSISAAKMENVSSQDINELRAKYVELQNHYQPIQNIIDSLTNDITTKYAYLISENEDALAAIDKLHTENKKIYEQMKSLDLKLELQQDEFDRRNASSSDENNALFQKIKNLDPSEEKMEVVRLNGLLQKEKAKNSQLNEHIKTMRKEKDELFDTNQKLLVENVEWKKAKTSQQETKVLDSSTLKSTKQFSQLEAISQDVKQKNKDISEALSLITPKKSNVRVIVKPSISTDNFVKQHLSQSIEIGAFFSDNLDRSFVKSFQPGDRIVRINDIKLANLTSTNFPQVMLQQVEGSLKLLIAPASISTGRIPFEEHNFSFSDEMSRCPSPCTFVDGDRLTPIPDYQRRISEQSHSFLSRTGTLTASRQPLTYDSTFTRKRADTRVDLDLSPRKLVDTSNKITISSCPPTPLFESKQEIPFVASKMEKRDALKSFTNDDESDFTSMESEPVLNYKPQDAMRRPNLLSLAKDSKFNRVNRYELDASPMFAKEFPGSSGSLEAMPDLFNARSDTGITGMIIFPRSETSSIKPGQQVSDVILNHEQICTTVPNDFFLKHAKISGGFGNPFFLSSSKDLSQFRLKSGQKIYQINDIATEYITYEMFIEQCKQTASITLFISMNPSPDFKPDELNVRDHFCVIPHFTTNFTRMKGELFVSPSCVYLVTDTLYSKDYAKQNRYWHVTRIDPRNCNTIEKGVIPSDMWLDYSVNHLEESFDVSIESRGPQSLNFSVSELEVFEHDISHYYDLEGVKNKQETDFTKSPFSCYTLVSRQDHLRQPVILFDYHWEEYSEKLASLSDAKNSTHSSSFKLIFPMLIENVDFAKNSELEAKQRASEIIYYKGADGRGRIVEAKTLRDCIDNHFTPVLVCPIAQIYSAPALVELKPIIIRLKFKYKYKFEAPVDQGFHFDDMLSVGLSEEKYSKKLANMIESNRVLYEWKAVMIES